MTTPPARARRVFLSGLGLIYVCAFGSLAAQIVGLVGERGILPVGEMLSSVSEFAGRTDRLAEAHHQLPTLSWLDPGDGLLRLQCIAGIVAGALVFLGVAPLLLLPIAWALYLSLSIAGQDFLQFQWDTLLLETGFFAIFIAPLGLLPWGWPRFLLLRRATPGDPLPPPPPPPSGVATWALWLLLFRFMFASGYVKLSANDETWRGLTALTFHYWTQPLPTPLAWYAHRAPLWFHRLSCALMFTIELGAPWLLFTGRIGRNAFAILTVMLMVGIAATGNYGFFEPLTILLALSMLRGRPPDPMPTLETFPSREPTKRRALNAVLGLSGTSDLPPPPRELPSKAARDPYATGLGTRIFRPIATIVSGTAAVLALVQFGGQLVERRITLAPDSPIPPWIRRAGDAVLDQVEWACVVEHPFREGDLRVDQMRFGGLLAWLQPFRTLNTYGLFRNMTTSREEVIVEGSDDGVTWKAYEFRWKPGDPRVAPPWCAPHMPRLDWQMWFLPFGVRMPPPWFQGFLRRLLENEPTVLALLADNPFPDSPPKFVRANFVDYRFSTPETRKTTGEWWFRSGQRVYSRPVSLR